MVPQDRQNFFELKVREIHRRAHTLHQTVQQGSGQPEQLVDDSLEQLQVALEELHVAEEELQQQNDELIAAQHLIEAERQRYQDLFEFAPDGYIETDIYGVIQEANRAALQLLNIELKHLRGKPLINFVVGEDRRSFRGLLNQLPDLQRVPEWEAQMCGRKSQPFAAALTIATVQDDEGQVVALRWLVRNITVRKQTEYQLRLAQLEKLKLLESDRLKTQFMATVSHELRSPMNAILGFSELLLRQFRQQDQPDQEMLPLIEPISRNGKRLLSLIEELLDFSSLQSYRLELQCERFDLVNLLRETAGDFRLLAEQKHLEIRLNLPEEPVLMLSDRQRIQQVVVNLLANAIKFTLAGSVTIELLERSGTRVAIAVRDTGIGIAPEDQSRIFQEFWQVNQAVTRHQGGIGLGLAISKSLVELMQGNLSVESELGKGTSFRLDLPRHICAEHRETAECEAET